MKKNRHTDTGTEKLGLDGCAHSEGAAPTSATPRTSRSLVLSGCSSVGSRSGSCQLLHSTVQQCVNTCTCTDCQHPHSTGGGLCHSDGSETLESLTWQCLCPTVHTHSGLPPLYKFTPGFFSTLACSSTKGLKQPRNLKQNCKRKTWLQNIPQSHSNKGVQVDTQTSGTQLYL